MTDNYNFAKVSVRPETKREIDIIAAQEQTPVYQIVEEMVAAWKATNVPAKDTQPVNSN